MYGILLSTGLLISIFLTEVEIKKSKMNLSIFWNCVLGGLLFGIIGARIYHVISLWNYYSDQPIKILYIWNGGIGIFGAILSTFVFIFLYLTIKKQPILKWLDLLVLFAPLAQSIGRWGNYFNQELYGRITTLPWGIYIKKTQSFHHPLFLYESVLDLGLFIILFLTYKNQLKSQDINRRTPVYGRIFLIYTIGYSIIRLVLEPLRTTYWAWSGIAVSQLISVVLIIVCLSFGYKKGILKEQ